MDIKIITPERMVLDVEHVDYVSLPAEGGEVGVMENHMPMVCNLAVGPIRVDKGDQQQHLATSGGFVEVLKNRVTILADTAELAQEIDVERARDAQRRAEERLQQQAERIDNARARGSLLRAINRLSVAQQA